MTYCDVPTERVLSRTSPSNLTISNMNLSLKFLSTEAAICCRNYQLILGEDGLKWVTI